MGTTRIKVIDLSSEKQEIKTSRKHAEKLSGLAALKKEKQKPARPAEPAATAAGGRATTEITEIKTEDTEKKSVSSVAARKSAPSRTPKLHPRGVKYLAVSRLVEKDKAYPAKEAIDLLGKISFTKFDPSVEAHLNVVAKNIQGSINFPHPVATPKEKKYLIFTDQKPAAAIQKQIIWGDEKTIADIENGKLKPGKNFDTVLATSKFMPSLAKIAKILGPRQMMPNPKNGTIIDNVEKALEIGSEALYEYKSDPSAPIIHTKIGKLSEKPEYLKENLKALITAIGQAKIKKVVIKSTMSPAIKVDISTLN